MKKVSVDDYFKLNIPLLCADSVYNKIRFSMVAVRRNIKNTYNEATIQ
jgi:hypothetical protein